jgi:hypothetical protein
MIRTYKYVVYAEDAVSVPLFVGIADTIEEARKIKFDAEFTHAAIVDGNLNEVE